MGKLYKKPACFGLEWQIITSERVQKTRWSQRQCLKSLWNSIFFFSFSISCWSQTPLQFSLKKPKINTAEDKLTFWYFEAGGLAYLCSLTRQRSVPSVHRATTANRMGFELKRLDIYRKIPKDLTQATTSGALVSVCCVAFITLMLMTGEEKRLNRNYVLH